MWLKKLLSGIFYSGIFVITIWLLSIVAGDPIFTNFISAGLVFIIMITGYFSFYLIHLILKKFNISDMYSIYIAFIGYILLWGLVIRFFGDNINSLIN